MMLSAVIGAGASLLGGILGNKAQRKAQAREAQAIREMNEYNDPKNVRARAEAAGFNPLLFIGPGVGQQTALPAISSANYLGSAIADAGMVIADQMSKNKELARLEKLSAENRKLAEKVQSLTIRPKVGGVYAQRETTGAINDSGNREISVSGSGAGSGGGGANSSVTHSLRPLAYTDPVDPRRKVEIKPVGSGSGFMKVDNPYLPEMWFPTIDGDEPLDVLDLPAFGAAIPQLGYSLGQYITYGGGRESRPNLTRAEALRLKAQRAPKRPKPDMANRWNQ